MLNSHRKKLSDWARILIVFRDSDVGDLMLVTIYCFFVNFEVRDLF